jgi:hypothetical protein
MSCENVEAREVRLSLGLPEQPNSECQLAGVTRTNRALGLTFRDQPLQQIEECLFSEIDLPCELLASGGRFPHVIEQDIQLGIQSPAFDKARYQHRQAVLWSAGRLIEKWIGGTGLYCLINQ